MSYRRTIPLGVVYGGDYGYKRALPAEIDVEIRDTERGPELAISGSIWRPNRSDIVAGGQCYEEIARAFPYASQVQRIVEVWQRWHLNGMNAACEHQRAYAAARGLKPHECFTTANGHIERSMHFSKPTRSAVGLYVERETRLITREMELVDERPSACFECGYSYGSAWLYEPLPQEIIEEVQTW